MSDKTILNISKKDGTTLKFILEEDKRAPLFGLNVGNEFNGELVSDELKGYKFKITGGSDDDGVPMRRDLEGLERKRILFKGRTPGYKPKNNEHGVRRRKLVRGSEIQDDIVQLNLKVLKEGSNKLQ